MTSPQTWFDGQLGHAVRFAHTGQPLAEHELSPAEERQMQRLLFPARRREWLCGRRALKRLLQARGRDTDTARIAFPDPGLSLTHSCGRATAVASEGLSGLGIDYEPWRRVAPGMARWYLTTHERDACIDDQRLLLRVWTIKEALFKACPLNGRLSLLSIRLGNPVAHVGTARAHGTTYDALRYASFETEHGVLSVAINPGKPHGYC